MSEPDEAFTLDHARGVIAGLRPQIDAFLAARADFAELRADLETTGTSRHGGLAEARTGHDSSSGARSSESRRWRTTWLSTDRISGPSGS